EQGQDAVRRLATFPPTAAQDQMETTMEMHTSASLREMHGIDVRARAPIGFGAWLSRLLKRLKHAERCRRDYEIRMAKSDHELRDIGLMRDDVVAAIEKGGRTVFRCGGR